jgi:hypothetical protein
MQSHKSVFQQRVEAGDREEHSRKATGTGKLAVTKTDTSLCAQGYRYCFAEGGRVLGTPEDGRLLHQALLGAAKDHDAAVVHGGYRDKSLSGYRIAKAGRIQLRVTRGSGEFHLPFQTSNGDICLLIRARISGPPDFAPDKRGTTERQRSVGPAARPSSSMSGG